MIIVPRRFSKTSVIRRIRLPSVTTEGSVADRTPKAAPISSEPSRATGAGGTLPALAFERLPGDCVPEGK